MKRTCLRLMALLLLVCSLATAADAAGAIHMTVEGQTVTWTDAAPYIKNNRTMVPLRAAAEAMGITVTWDNATRRVDFTKTYSAEDSIESWKNEDGSTGFLMRLTLRMWVGSTRLETSKVYASASSSGTEETGISGGSDTMDTAPVLKGGRTYAPIRYVAEQFGYDVLWDNAARTVRLVDALPVNWGYAYTAIPKDAGHAGVLVLGIYNPVNLTNIEVTQVSVSTTGTGAETTVCTLREPTEKEAQKLRSYVGTGETFLDVAAAEYTFTAGSTYRITYQVRYTKSNDAARTEYGSFTVTIQL